MTKKSTKTKRQTDLRKAKTGFAVLWHDEYDSREHGCYAVFHTRDEAVDYAMAVVRERADTLGVKVLDQESFKEEWSDDDLRYHLSCGNEVRLVLSNDALGNPFEYVSVGVAETLIASRDPLAKYRGLRFKDLRDFDTVRFKGKRYRTWTFDIGKGRAVTFADIKLQDALYRHNEIDNAVDHKVTFYVYMNDDVANTIEIMG